MTHKQRSQHLPVIACIITALMLAIIPMPNWASLFRPDWLALTLIYWTMMLPRTYSVGTAWIVGIVLDVAQGTLLGQHAIALCFVVYITVKFHLQLRVFPISQMSATVFVILAFYQFVLFWINGVAGVNAPAVTYWGPVVIGALIWPLLTLFFTSVYYRVRQRS
ncbi:rod shape-determining protein MreD [Woeseiaceae bacterium]|nr:rod shape-determining protein MreD [Woeseiaceae bacterium]